MSIKGPHGINYARADTDPKFTLGDVVETSEGTFKYVQANGAVAQYAACKVDDDGQVAELTTAISGSEPTAVGILQIALADNEYGWAFVGPGGGSGKGIKVKVAASCAADVKIGTTATPGVLDDTIGDTVQGVKILTADGGAGSAIELYAVQRLVTNCQD